MSGYGLLLLKVSEFDPRGVISNIQNILNFKGLEGGTHWAFEQREVILKSQLLKTRKED